MFQIQKTFDIAVSHNLNLPYDSPCNRKHGHNLKITVYCRATDEQVWKNNNMVVDFAHVKAAVHTVLDHRDLNDVLQVQAVVQSSGTPNPTSEFLAYWICEHLVASCYRVDVQESDGNVATYIRD
jgi:6-pyruvoyltetrahydropterin/6-carboxytetrahydropterin synthase